MGGDTTSLRARGKANTEESKDVKSRAYRVNMIISLGCLVGRGSARERKPFKSSEEPHRNKRLMGRAIILESRVKMAETRAVPRPLLVNLMYVKLGSSAYQPALSIYVGCHESKPALRAFILVLRSLTTRQSLAIPSRSPAKIV